MFPKRDQVVNLGIRGALALTFMAGTAASAMRKVGTTPIPIVTSGTATGTMIATTAGTDEQDRPLTQLCAI